MVIKAYWLVFHLVSFADREEEPCETAHCLYTMEQHMKFDDAAWERSDAILDA